MPSDFSDTCVNRRHEGVHYDLRGYMRCNLDGKYVYADGRPITFTDPEDQERYTRMLTRLTAVFGSAKSRVKEGV